MTEKIAEKAARFPLQHCPVCDNKINAASHVSKRGEYKTPSAGDLSVCIRCGNWLIFGEDLSLRPLTSEERRELAPEERAKLIAMTMATNQK